MPKELTNKQQAFCREYLKDNNGKEAAIRAGYKPNSAKVTACRMLTQADCKAELGRLRAELTKEVGITIAQLTEKRLFLLETAIDKGNLQAADRMLQALEKHKGYYEEDNRQAQAQAQAAAEMSPDEAIAYHLRCLNRLKAVREAPDARSTG